MPKAHAVPEGFSSVFPAAFLVRASNAPRLEFGVGGAKPGREAEAAVSLRAGLLPLRNGFSFSHQLRGFGGSA